jgi:cytochrome c556
MRRRITAALAVGSAVGLLSAASLGAAEAATLKQLMGDNYAGLQKILVALIHSNYAEVPAQATLIAQHAEQLRSRVPASAQGDRDRFLFYAYNLETHAKDMKSISELLIEQDKKHGEKLQETQLREALAAHYGGVVEMCVSCHNRFRQRALP